MYHFALFGTQMCNASNRSKFIFILFFLGTRCVEFSHPIGGCGGGWFFGLGCFSGFVVGGALFFVPSFAWGYVGWDGVRMGRYVVCQLFFVVSLCAATLVGAQLPQYQWFSLLASHLIGIGLVDDDRRKNYAVIIINCLCRIRRGKEQCRFCQLLQLFWVARFIQQLQQPELSSFNMHNKQRLKAKICLKLPVLLSL